MCGEQCLKELSVFLFLLMINDLKTNVPTYKYVGDTTMFKVINDTLVQEVMDTIIVWSLENNMKINTKKTKEICVRFSKVPPQVPLMNVEGKKCKRVECVTLLGLKITNDFAGS